MSEIPSSVRFLAITLQEACLRWHPFLQWLLFRPYPTEWFSSPQQVLTSSISAWHLFPTGEFSSIRRCSPSLFLATIAPHRYPLLQQTLLLSIPSASYWLPLPTGLHIPCGDLFSNGCSSSWFKPDLHSRQVLSIPWCQLRYRGIIKSRNVINKITHLRSKIKHNRHCDYVYILDI